MCTLTLAWRTFADEPVVVAANRDELHDRPSEPPARRTVPAIGADAVAGDDGTAGSDRVATVTPLDAEAGGTWIGYAETGLLAGVTNRWVRGLAAERSRGLLVRDALGAPDAETAVRVVEAAVADHEYDGFNLVVADDVGAFLLEWDGYLSVTRLDPGVHVVVNVGAALNGGGVPAERFFAPDHRPASAERQADNARRVRDALVVEPGEAADDWVGRATTVLADHDYGVCVHGDDDDPETPPAGFGTRSSSVVRPAADPDRRFRFADGPPCETPYRGVEAAVGE